MTLPVSPVDAFGTRVTMLLCALGSLILIVAVLGCASDPAASPPSHTSQSAPAPTVLKIQTPQPSTTPFGTPLLIPTSPPTAVPAPIAAIAPVVSPSPFPPPLPTPTSEPFAIILTPFVSGHPAGPTREYAMDCGAILREASARAGDAEVSGFDPELLSELLDDLSLLSPPRNMELYHDGLLALISEAREAEPSSAHPGFESETRYLYAVTNFGSDENEIMTEHGCLGMSGILGRLILTDPCVEKPSDYDVNEYIIAEGKATKYRGTQTSDAGDRTRWYWGSDRPQSETIVTFDRSIDYGQLNRYYFRNAVPGGWSEWKETPPERLSPPLYTPTFRFCGRIRITLGSLTRRGEEVLDGQLVTRYSAQFRRPLASAEESTGTWEIWVDGEGRMVREIVKSFERAPTLKRDYYGWGAKNNVVAPRLEGRTPQQPETAPRVEPVSTDGDQIPLEIIDTGPGTVFISPDLLGLLYSRARGDPFPATVSVIVRDSNFRPFDEGTRIGRFIVEGGGTKEEGAAWRLPIEQVAAVMQQGEVAWMLLPGDTSRDPVPTRYANVYGGLGPVVRAYEAGVPEVQAAEYGGVLDGNRIFIEMWANDASTILAVRAWLSREGIALIPPNAGEFTSSGSFSMAGMLRVSLVTPIAKTFPSVELRAEDFFSDELPLSRRWWPEEVLEYVSEIVGMILDAQQAGEEATRD